MGDTAARAQRLRAVAGNKTNEDMVIPDAPSYHPTGSSARPNCAHGSTSLVIGRAVQKSGKLAHITNREQKLSQLKIVIARQCRDRTNEALGSHVTI